MFKKGQAAMEFLMTYGWAILVVLIAIGALAYFGVLNPSKFLPSSCTIAPGVACTEFKVSTAGSGTITLILSNGKGNDINFTGVTFKTTSTTGCSLTISPHVVAPDGGTGTVTVTGCGQVGSAGSRFKADIFLTYLEAGSTLGTRNFSGSMVSKVET